jgi:hypothetical protein
VSSITISIPLRMRVNAGRPPAARRGVKWRYWYREGARWYKTGIDAIARGFTS